LIIFLKTVHDKLLTILLVLLLFEKVNVLFGEGWSCCDVRVCMCCDCELLWCVWFETDADKFFFYCFD